MIIYDIKDNYIYSETQKEMRLPHYTLNNKTLISLAF